MFNYTALRCKQLKKFLINKVNAYKINLTNMYSYLSSLKFKELKESFINKVNTYRIDIINIYLYLTSIEFRTLVKKELCIIIKSLLQWIRDLVEVHIELYFYFIILTVITPWVAHTIILFQWLPSRAYFSLYNLIHIIIPHLVTLFYKWIYIVTIWVVPAYCEYMYIVVTALIVITFDLLDLTISYFFINLFYIFEYYMIGFRYTLRFVISIFYTSKNDYDALNQFAYEICQCNMLTERLLWFEDKRYLVCAERAYQYESQIVGIPVERGWSDLSLLHDWEDVAQIMYFSNLDAFIANPVNYRRLVSSFITVNTVINAVNTILNYTYNTVLFVYVMVLLLYTIFRDINYSKITLIINTILSTLFVLSAFKLMLGGEVWSVSSDLKINNVLTPLNLFSLYYDNLTFTFLFTIYIISFMVHKYQFSYLNTSPMKENFLIMFNVFILSMVGVVSTSNWYSLLLSWEVLGLSSFFLIGYYKNKPTALKSALKAFAFNKLSDLFLLITFALCYFTYGTFYFVQQPLATPTAEWISTFILLTAFVKSAQFCFYFWLPDSMEAPIPASALIHSATLVSAGIYLVLRVLNLLEVSNTPQYLLLIIPSITMVVTSLIAYNQTDIKKLLAYSTIANCGFIYFLIFLKAYKLALIYFVIHGIIKSFSFLVAGELITENNHAQDIRKWVNFNLYTRLKLLLLAALLLLLCGMPLSMIYSIKSGLYYSNYTSGYTYTWGSLSLILYTLNSYLYGLKLIIFMVNKKVFYNKYRKFCVRSSELHVSTGLLFVVYLSLLAGIVMITSFAVVTVNPILSWKWLLSFLLLTVGFIYTTLRDEILYIQVLIPVVFILNILV